MSERLPRQVLMLGIVSLCMDTSSELIHSLRPVFLVGVLGASPVVLGLIEGIAEATASLLRIVSAAPATACASASRCCSRGTGSRRCRSRCFRSGGQRIDRAARARGGPYRQGHPRRAARCAGGRCDTRCAARCGVRVSPGTRHDRRGARPAARAHRDAAPCGRYAHGAVDRGRAGDPRAARAGAGRGTAAMRRRHAPLRIGRAGSRACGLCRVAAGSRSKWSRC